MAVLSFKKDTNITDVKKIVYRVSGWKGIRRTVLLAVLFSFSIINRSSPVHLKALSYELSDWLIKLIQRALTNHSQGDVFSSNQVRNESSRESAYAKFPALATRCDFYFSSNFVYYVFRVLNSQV